MTLQEYNLSLTGANPPTGISAELIALWYDYQGNWNRAHQIAQDITSNTGSWIHAYLHRKEGDEWNAGYWYRLAQQPFPSLTLSEEWEELVQYCLK